MHVLSSVMNIALVGATTSFGERMKVGLLGTLSGMIIVFVALLLIAAILSSFKYLNKSIDKKEKAKSNANVQPVVDQPVEEIVESQQDDLELVAVITAAIASSLNTSSDRLRVRSLRRVNGNKSAWNAASRQENIQNNF